MANTYQPITSWTRIAPRLFSFGVMCALLAGAAVIFSAKTTQRPGILLAKYSTELHRLAGR